MKVQFGVDATEIALFRDTVRKFAEREISPHFAQWERDGIFPRELWHKLGQEGFLCPDIPEAYGGIGAPFVYANLVTEELSRLGFASIAVGTNVHSNICAHYILNNGTEAQKQTYLPKMTTGECVVAIGMTEPGAGSDLQGIRTAGRQEGDTWTIDGQKTFISNGQHCDMCITAVRTDPNAKGSKGTTMFLLDATAPGFQRGRNLEKIGLHSADTSELFFENMRVNCDKILGELNRGFLILMHELPRERLGIAAQAVAAAEGALAWTVDYVNERRAFGQPVSAFQNTRFQVADMQTKTRAGRAFVNECVDLFLAGELDADTAAMLKLFTTELQDEVVDGCLQLFGGYGYMTEYPIARAYVDSRIQRIYGGTSEIMKEIIGRSIFGR